MYILFTTIGGNISKEINLAISFTDKNCAIKVVRQTIYPRPKDEKEVKKIISLKHATNSRDDKIKTTFLKLIVDYILSIITYLINKIITNRKIPQFLKRL